MNDINENKISDHHQDAGVKKAKRIASIIYIIVLTFIVGGSWLHQKKQLDGQSDAVEVIEFKQF